MDVVDPDAIHIARDYTRRALASELEAPWLAAYHANGVSGDYRYDSQDAGRRRLRNLALDYLASLDSAPTRQLALNQFSEADNMTDSLAALAALMRTGGEERERALETFYERWKSEPLVLDKWFTLQAMAQRPGTLDRVKQLMHDPAFSMRNPNRVRALIGAFAQGNPTGFHAADGSGYGFVGEQVQALDALNPQVAARMVGVFSRWRRYDDGRQAHMKTELERLKALELSRDVYEIVSKSLQ
jgi:aminopeptidase N